MTTVVIATTSDLSQLKNTAYTKIGNNFILNYDEYKEKEDGEESAYMSKINAYM